MTIYLESVRYNWYIQKKKLRGVLLVKESLKNKFRFNDLEEGEVIDKKIHFDFNSLIGNLKNIIVFVISVLVSSLKLASRSNSIWNFNICCDKFSRCSTYNSLGINFNNYWNYFWWYFFN